MVLLDQHGRVRHANAAMLDLLGWSREELVGQDWFDTCLPEEARVPVRGGFALIVAGEIELMSHYTNEVLARDGRRVAIAWTNSLARVGGRITGTLSIGHPAGPEPVSADALRAHRYQQLFDDTPVGLLSMDRQGRIALANARASRLLQRPVEQIAGLTLSELVLPDHPRASVQAVTETAPGGETNVELPLLRSNGTTTWVRCAASAGEDAETGEPVVRVGLVEADAERQDRQALSGLAKELGARNTDLRRFADVLSHDLRGPLQALVGRLELLGLRQDLGPDSLGDAARALEAAQGMSQLMEDLRGSWAQPATRASSDSDEAFAVAVREMDLVLSQAGATVTRDRLPRVNARRERLIQVFRNLLGNSAKYRGTRPLQIQARAVAMQDAWRIEIQDNGQGFPPEVAEGLFEPGERQPNHAHIGGQGLGLAICRHLLAIDGGTIEATGQPERGAVFTLTLPLAAD